MSAQPALRLASRPPRGSPGQPYPATTTPRPMDRAVRLARRRRLQHLRRRRRDLLEDLLTAIVLVGFALSLTPGLGVIAILAVPVALALVGTVVVERRRRRLPPAPPRATRRASRT
jgi:hypothetical protein